jgi:hypothetical protein
MRRQAHPTANPDFRQQTGPKKPANNDGQEDCQGKAELESGASVQPVGPGKSPPETNEPRCGAWPAYLPRKVREIAPATTGIALSPSRAEPLGRFICPGKRTSA